LFFAYSTATTIPLSSSDDDSDNDSDNENEKDDDASQSSSSEEDEEEDDRPLSERVYINQHEKGSSSKLRSEKADKKAKALKIASKRLAQMKSTKQETKARKKKSKHAPTESSSLRRDYYTSLNSNALNINSSVRQSLEDGRFDPEEWSNAKNPSKKFGLKKFTTPSTGLRIKGLCIRPNFAIPKGGTGSDADAKHQLENRYNYSLESATKGDTDALNLIFLPQKNPNAGTGRTVNICTMPGHDIWDTNKLRNDDGGRSAKAYFQKAFPRFDWDEIVSEDEWELFASTEGSRFPQCQYSPSLYVSSKPRDHEGTTTDGAGVVLIGDALHAFPPDLGQGVNSAFCDAMVLGESFEEAASDAVSAASTAIDPPKSFVARALNSYQAKNRPETRALIELARCGAPYQYNQPSKMMKLGKKIWMANVLLRLFLNKATLGLSPKPAILMMMDSRSSFRKIMRKANTLTAILWSSLLLCVVSLIRSRVGV